MILLTDDLREHLLANGRDPDADHVPVVKFFNPLSTGVWLATQLYDDGDTLFGFADLGFPEYGTFSLENWPRSACPSAWASSATSTLPLTCRSRSGPKPPIGPAA